MARSRGEFHKYLKETTGCEHVYYQPPASIIMFYPCIVYKLNSIQNDFADDIVYSQKRNYLVTVIDSNPDSDLSNAVSLIPSCRFQQEYSTEGLHHFVYVIYY